MARSLFSGRTSSADRTIRALSSLHTGLALRSLHTRLASSSHHAAFASAPVRVALAWSWLRVALMIVEARDITVEGALRALGALADPASRRG